MSKWRNIMKKYIHFGVYRNLGMLLMNMLILLKRNWLFHWKNFIRMKVKGK